MARWLDVLDSDGDRRPAPPPSGIPVQRLPRSVRRLLQLSVYPFVFLDVLAQRAIRLVLRPRWQLSGRCQRSGSCCRYITQHRSTGFLAGRAADKLLRFWATEVNGFYAREFDVGETDGDADVIVYSCRYLSEAGTCENYALRPALCRTWPRVDFFSEPQLHKGCGYSASPRAR